MTTQEFRLATRLIEAIESIAHDGIDIYINCGDDKMAIDLAAMKVAESIEKASESINDMEGN